jgi:hypothetical protein
MADNLFNVGTRLTADEYLKIISFMNKREMDDNRLIRGLGTLTGVSTSDLPSSGLETTLRRYSTANDEEILGKIIYNMADGDYKTEKEYVREYKRRTYPPLFMEKALAEWRRTKGREESASAEGRAVRDQEIQELELTQKQKLWPLNVESKKLSIKDTKAKSTAKAMIAVAKRAADIDIKAIRGGKDYYEVVRDRIEDNSYGWEKEHSDYYKSLMDMSGLEPKATSTTKAVYDTRNGEQRWMTEDDIQAINKAEGPETILPASAEPPDEQQVSMAMLSAAGQVLYDEAVLKTAGIEAEEARIVLQQWASDKSWLSRFNEIPEHLRKLHQEWYRAYEGVMDRWYTTTTTGKVIGG